jgi:hypothetical protein
MKRRLMQLWVWISRRWIHKIDLSAKCPACGCVHKHKISFARDFKHIIHCCAICNAVWGQATIVPHDTWKVNDTVVQPDNVMQVPARFVSKKS